MKYQCVLNYDYPSGLVGKCKCYGNTMEEMENDVEDTIKRLNLNKDYCFITDESW